MTEYQKPYSEQAREAYDRIFSANDVPVDVVAQSMAIKDREEIASDKR